MIIWCMVPQIWSVTDRTFTHFGSFFAVYPPPSPNNLENQDFEKMKNILKKWKKKKWKKKINKKKNEKKKKKKKGEKK